MAKRKFVDGEKHPLLFWQLNVGDKFILFSDRRKNNVHLFERYEAPTNVIAPRDGSLAIDLFLDGKARQIGNQVRVIRILGDK